MLARLSPDKKRTELATSFGNPHTLPHSVAKYYFTFVCYFFSIHVVYNVIIVCAGVAIFLYRWDMMYHWPLDCHKNRFPYYNISNNYIN